MGGHYAIEKRKTPQLVFTGIDDIVVLADYITIGLLISLEYGEPAE